MLGWEFEKSDCYRAKDSEGGPQTPQNLPPPT